MDALPVQNNMSLIHSAPLAPSGTQKTIKRATFNKEVPIRDSRVKIMYIIRGLPGSGKSNFCRNLLVHILNFPCSIDSNTGDVILTQKNLIMFRNYILSTDDFFSNFKDGKMEYMYDPKRVQEYIETNKLRARIQASLGVTPLFIDNVNATIKDVRDYNIIGAEFRYEVHIIESSLFYNNPKLADLVKDPQWLFKNRNVNNLPIDVYQRARANYEPWDLFPKWSSSES